MEHKRLDKIVFRIAVVLLVIAVFCLIVVPKPSAEFYISLVSGVIAFLVAVISAIRIMTDKNK